MALYDADLVEELHLLSRASLATVTAASRSDTLDVENYRPASHAKGELIIPKPDIFSFPTQPLDADLPSNAECAAHLELLEAFFVVRQTVIKSKPLDEVYGTKPVHKTVTRRDGSDRKLKDDEWWNTRQVKWTRYLELAVARFDAWHRHIQKSDVSSSLQITNATLPPLDVLMVWHAFLLNPKLFKDTCGDSPLYSLEFPWECIHKAINAENWQFNLSEEAAENFKNATKLAPVLFKEMTAWRYLHIVRSLEYANFKNETSQAPLDRVPEQVREHVLAFHAMDPNLGIALRDAVVRQSSFVDKMNSHLWIRSPALEGTLGRARDRYCDFLKMFKMFPRQALVPTLDIDLVWHTHQCRAAKYLSATIQLAGKFLNHDDTVVPDKLSDGFNRTRTWYYVRFGKEYAICGCWDCEALLTRLEAMGEKGNEGPNFKQIAEEVQQEVQYYRALEIHRQKSNPPPS